MVRSAVLALVFFILLAFDIWALVGIANDEITWFRYLNYFGIYIPLVTLVLLIGVLYFYKSSVLWLKLIVFVLGLPSLIWPYVFINVFYGSDVQAIENHDDDSQFSFVTFSKMSRNKNFDEISKLVDCTKYDVITIQESIHMEAKANKGMFGECNYLFNKNGNIAVFSSFTMREIKSNGFGGLFLIEFPDGNEVYVLGFRFEKVLSFDSNVYIGKIEQLEIVESWLSEIDAPVLLAGDFNDTLFNYTLFSISQRMNYAKPGMLLGFNNTFPANGRMSGWGIPFIKIDHVFYKGVSIVGAKVLSDSYGSDHYPIFNEFRFEEAIVK